MKLGTIFATIATTATVLTTAATAEAANFGGQTKSITLRDSQDEIVGTGSFGYSNQPYEDNLNPRFSVDINDNYREIQNWNLDLQGEETQIYPGVGLYNVQNQAFSMFSVEGDPRNYNPDPEFKISGLALGNTRLGETKVFLGSDTWNAPRKEMSGTTIIGSDTTKVPEPSQWLSTSIALCGMGGCLLRRRFKNQISKFRR